MDNANPGGAILTAAQTASLLGVSRATVTRAARDGRLPAAEKLPGRTGALLFRREDVEALSGKLARSAS